MKFASVQKLSKKISLLRNYSRFVSKARFPFHLFF